MSNTYTGKVAKSPKVTDKSIFFVLEPENAKSLAVIGFFKNLDKEYIAKLREFKANQEVTFLGREHTNNKTGAKEIIIEGPVVEEISLEDALNTPVNLVPLEERTLADRKYKFMHGKTEVVFWSDGIYAWKDGHKDKKAKMTYDFVETYNHKVTSDNWLMPDWYAIEVAKRHQAALNANSKVAALLEEMSVY